MDAIKVCGKCSTTKPLQAFDRDTRRPDGRKSLCKTCARALDKAYHERNHASRLAQMAAYRSENRTCLRLRWNQFYRDHKEEALAYAAKARDAISDNYVRSRVGLRKEQVTPEVVSLKRDAIAMRRLARLLKEASNAREKDH